VFLVNVVRVAPHPGMRKGMLEVHTLWLCLDLGHLESGNVFFVTAVCSTCREMAMVCERVENVEPDNRVQYQARERKLRLEDERMSII
jgi:hypothetical protein